MDKDWIIQLYEYFYRKTKFKRKYKLKLGKLENKWIDNFLNSLDQSYNKEWFFEYFLFQFAYWYRLKQEFNGDFQLNWVIGIKALDRYRNRNKDGDYYRSEFSRRLRIKYSDLVKETKKDLVPLNRVEDLERKRFLNEDLKGLLHCVSYTTLFDPRSEACKVCKTQKECIEIQVKTYTGLYEKRTQM